MIIPRARSFLTYRAWTSEVKGLDEFPRDAWPDNVELVYFSYHIMVGLGATNGDSPTHTESQFPRG